MALPQLTGGLITFEPLCCALRMRGTAYLLSTEAMMLRSCYREWSPSSGSYNGGRSWLISTSVKYSLSGSACRTPRVDWQGQAGSCALLCPPVPSCHSPPQQSKNDTKRVGPLSFRIGAPPLEPGKTLSGRGRRGCTRKPNPEQLLLRRGWQRVRSTSR